jgi:hypothetical protein
MPPRHMRLQDRKAYALQAAYFNAVRAVAANIADTELERVSATVLDFSKQAFDEQPPGEQALDKFLTDSVHRVETIVDIRCGAIVPAPAASVLMALRQRAASIKCVDCDGGRICSGHEQFDDEIIEAQHGGQCIHEIKYAFEVAIERARSAYAECIPSGSEPPRLTLQTEGIGHLTSQIPGHQLAINATTRFDDGDEGKASEVNVTITPLQLNRVSMAAMQYLLWHEVFCHGFQMLSRTGSRPNKKNIPDPVSEGMMDLIAIEILSEQARVPVGKNIDDREIAKRDAGLARQLHLARASLDLSPRFPEAPQVALGVAALEAVQALYDADDPKRAKEDAFALVFRLNIASWDYGHRHNGLTRIALGLEIPRDTDLVALLLRFRRNRNVIPLIEYLTKN